MFRKRLVWIIAQRASLRATAQTGGFGGGRGGNRMLTSLAKPLVELLTQRAAE